MKSFRSLMSWPSVGLVSILCIAGMGCKTGREARKTLPEHFKGRQMEEQLWENSRENGDDNLFANAMPFYAVDTTVDGKNFTAIYLRNAAFDSLAFNIVKSYEPYASSIFRMIQEQGVKGVILDFRQHHDTEGIQTSFSVSKLSNKSAETATISPVNISFITDESSDGRADLFINELRSSPLVAATELKNKNSLLPSSQTDCFKPASPDFNGQ